MSRCRALTTPSPSPSRKEGDLRPVLATPVVDFRVWATSPFRPAAILDGRRKWQAEKPVPQRIKKGEKKIRIFSVNAVHIFGRCCWFCFWPRLGSARRSLSG